MGKRVSMKGKDEEIWGEKGRGERDTGELGNAWRGGEKGMEMGGNGRRGRKAIMGFTDMP